MLWYLPNEGCWAQIPFKIQHSLLADPTFCLHMTQSRLEVRSMCPCPMLGQGSGNPNVPAPHFFAPASTPPCHRFRGRTWKQTAGRGSG